MNFSNLTLVAQNVTTSSSISLSDLPMKCIKIFFSLSAIVANGLILVLHKKNAILRKDAKRLQIALAVADMIFGISVIVTTLDGWRIQLLNNWYTNTYCLLIDSTTLFGDAFSLTLTLVLAVERCVAIWFPLRYRSMNKKKFAFLLIFFAFISVVGFCGLSFYGADNSKKPSSCGGSGNRIVALKPMLSYFNCAVGSAVVVLYVVAILGIRLKSVQLQRVGSDTVNEMRELFKKELEATKVVLVVVVGCILFYVAPNVIVAIITYINSTFNAGAYVSLLSLIHCSANFFIYLWKDNKMRKAFVNWTRGQNMTMVTTIKQKQSKVGDTMSSRF